VRIDHAGICSNDGLVLLVLGTDGPFFDEEPVPLGDTDRFGVLESDRPFLRDALIEAVGTGRPQSCRVSYDYDGRHGSALVECWPTPIGVLLLSQDDGDLRLALTAHERDLLQRLADGETADEVAASWGVRADSVRASRRRLVAKLGCRTACEAVAHAIRSGLI